MASRLLAQLDEDARTATSPETWSRAVCRSAAYLARQGFSAEANDRILKVRNAFGGELHVDVASWVMLAEGVLHFTLGEMYQAYDRIRRAYGLAVALRSESARPSCAAWMAHIEFNSGRFDLMCTHLIEVLIDAKPEDYNARGRACAVLADAYQRAGRYDLARPWYEQTRLHATAEGDQAMLSAVLYNVAAFRTANLRLADTFGELDTSEMKRAIMEANSSLTYDFAVGSTSFISLGPMLFGQLLCLDGRFSEASILLDEIIEKNLRPSDLVLLLCDRAWCYANLDRHLEAEEICSKVISSISALTDTDDIAYTNFRISQIFQLLNGESELSRMFRSQAITAIDAHKAFQIKLLTKLTIVAESIAENRKPG